MGHISEFHTVFTDSLPPEPVTKLLEEQGVRLVLTEA